MLLNIDSAATPTATKFSDLWGDFVVTGGVPSTSETLTVTVPECVAYTTGQRVVSPSVPITVPASSDNYLDVDNTGAFHVTSVANDAGVPVVYANSQRLAKLVSSATAITGVTDLREMTPSSQAVNTLINALVPTL